MEKQCSIHMASLYQTEDGAWMHFQDTSFTWINMLIFCCQEWMMLCFPIPFSIFRSRNGFYNNLFFCRFLWTAYSLLPVVSLACRWASPLFSTVGSCVTTVSFFFKQFIWLVHQMLFSSHCWFLCGINKTSYHWFLCDNNRAYVETSFYAWVLGDVILGSAKEVKIRWCLNGRMKVWVEQGW